MHVQESNLRKILAGWPIELASAFTPLAGGTNNQVWLVGIEDGSSYVLRLTAGLSDLPRLRYEAALLAALHKTELPFLLPLPLPARTGDVLVLTELDNAEQAIATLTPLLPGHVPARNAANIAQAGTALARLDVALASIPASILPVNAGSTPAHRFYRQSRLGRFPRSSSRLSATGRYFPCRICPSRCFTATMVPAIC